MKRARGAARSVVSLIAVLALPSFSWAGPVLWIDDDRNRLYTVDLDTQAAVFIGNISATEELTDIAMSPNGELWGISFGSIWIIDKTTASATAVGQHGISGGNALTFDSEGRLFAAGGSSDRLYSIDTATGAGTPLPGSMGAGSAGDIVFADDALYLADDSGRLTRLLLSGPFPYAVTPITVGNFSVSNVFGLALASDTTGRLFATAGDTVYEVNKVTAELAPFATLPVGVRANGATSEYAASIVITDPPGVVEADYKDIRILGPESPDSNVLRCNAGVGSPQIGSARRKLVLLIHGWGSEPAAWATPLQEAIVANIQARRDPGVWDVCTLDWSRLAGGLGSSVSPGDNTPWYAYANGPLVADAIWPILNSRRYGFAHLVGHSAGSLIVNLLAISFKNPGASEPAVVHTTFLDAYDAGFNTELAGDLFNSQYGCHADWADSYVDMRGDIFGLIRNTNLQLQCALNIDVTRVDPVQNANFNPLNLLLAGLEDQRVHAWPYRLYSYTAGVQDRSTDGLDPLDVWVFGFGASRESMRFDSSNNPNSWQPFLRRDPNDPTGLPSYTASGIRPGDKYCLSRVSESDGITRTRTVSCDTGATIDAPPTLGEPIEQVWTGFLLGPDSAWQGPTAVSTPSTTGIVTIDLPGPDLVRLTNRSPAWITYSARLSEAIDTIRFDFRFSPASAGNGLLSVFVDNKPIYRMTQAVAGDGTRSSGLIRVGRLPPGFHSLAFRLDNLTDVQSEVTISSLESGVVTIERAAAVAPVAIANAPPQARFGSVVALEGSATQQQGPAPSAVTFFWSQIAGPSAVISDAQLRRTQFTPTTAGEYRMQLKARNLWLTSQPAVVSVRVPILGDVDLDGDVDKADVSQIRAAISSQASGPNDVRDLNGDLQISESDVAVAKSLCTAGDCDDKASKGGGGGSVDPWALFALTLAGAGAAMRRRTRRRDDRLRHETTHVGNESEIANANCRMI